MRFILCTIQSRGTACVENYEVIIQGEGIIIYQFVKIQILPSGAYFTLYMQDCSHYKMRENKRHLSCGFHHITVKMRRVTCVKNCSRKAKSQPNLNFYVLPSGISNGFSVSFKQLVGHSSVLIFALLVLQLLCKGSVFLQFYVKIESSMHQIFT